MAVVKSGASTDQWTIDPTSKAGRVTLYDSAGSEVATAGGTVSTANSTTALLGAGATFTGTFESIKNTASLVVTVIADQIGTMNVNFSTDGTTVSSTTQFLARNVGSGNSFTLTPTAEYFRITFTNNGGVAQTVFRLETILKSGAVGLMSMPVTGGIQAGGGLPSAAPVISIPNDGAKATYGGSDTIAPVAAATDIFTITGSSTRVVRVTRIVITATRTAAGAVEIQLLKRSTPDTGGTPVVVATAPYDSLYGAATAVITRYTTNPTLGTLVASIDRRFVFVPTAAVASGGNTFAEFTFGNRPSQAVVLRGVSEQLVVSLGGATVAGGTIEISVEFTEE